MVAETAGKGNVGRDASSPPRTVQRNFSLRRRRGRSQGLEYLQSKPLLKRPKRRQHVQAHRQFWKENFRGPLVDSIPDGSAQFCFRLAVEAFGNDDGVVGP